MSARHTPGPWTRVGQTVYSLMHNGWRKGVEQYRNRFSCYVQIDGACSAEEAEANACLITAAPELLAALQGMLTEFGGDTGGIGAKGRCEALCIAGEAVAKAMGEGELAASKP